MSNPELLSNKVTHNQEPSVRARALLALGLSLGAVGTAASALFSTENRAYADRPCKAGEMPDYYIESSGTFPDGSGYATEIAMCFDSPQTTATLLPPPTTAKPKPPVTTPPARPVSTTTAPATTEVSTTTAPATTEVSTTTAPATTVFASTTELVTTTTVELDPITTTTFVTNTTQKERADVLMEQPTTKENSNSANTLVGAVAIGAATGGVLLLFGFKRRNRR